MWSIVSVLLKFMLDNALGIAIGLVIGWGLPTPTWVSSGWSWFLGKLRGLAP